jgi:hypothetical protein
MHELQLETPSRVIIILHLPHSATASECLRPLWAATAIASVRVHYRNSRFQAESQDWLVLIQVEYS